MPLPQLGSTVERLDKASSYATSKVSFPVAFTALHAMVADAYRTARERDKSVTIAKKKTLVLEATTS
jgi:hypothetical protein